MPDILIRDVPEDTKRRLQERAAANNRSQSAEAVAILEAALEEAPKKTWFDMLRETVEEVGGVELERPTWTPSREIIFE